MYRARLLRDLNAWAERGLVQPPQVAAMMADYDSRPSSFSLGRVLAVLAALLVAAAILLLVASNWEAIPRLVRLGVCVLLVWSFYLGGAWLTTRGQTSLAAAVLLLATLSFGAAVSLVAQMYHLSGDELQMLLLWFAVACLGAIFFRSGSQVVVSGFLAWAYFGIYLEQSSAQWFGWQPLVPPIMAALVLVLVHYAAAARARHLVYLLVIGWLTWIYSLHQGLGAAIAYTAVGLVAFLGVSLPIPRLSTIVRNAGMAPAFYTFVVVSTGLLMLHFEIGDGLPLAELGVVTLAIPVGALMLCGRDNGAVRYLAYTVFAAEILYLGSQTIGSIIGTSGFFLVSGLLVALVAWLVMRLERRFLRAAKEEVAR